MARNVEKCYKNIDFEICVFFQFELRAQTALSKVVFSSRRNDLPAKLCDVPPVRIVTFSDSSWEKSLSVTFQALREFRQRMSEGSGTTAREEPHAKRAGGTVADKLGIYKFSDLLLVYFALNLALNQ